MHECARVYLVRTHKRLGHSAISSTITCSDQIGDTATFEERVQIRARIEVLDEL
jgi:hypothetical protein